MRNRGSVVAVAMPLGVSVAVVGAAAVAARPRESSGASLSHPPPLFSLSLSLSSQQVALPQGESCAAWVAVHAIDFFNDVTTIWAVSKFVVLAMPPEKVACLLLWSSSSIRSIRSTTPASFS